ncbi:MAG: ribbon-helix-helix domain-containing protein, partial [Candidatus Thermoplasmatota archaeon]|nr:ribbon-helix-helix domain-containing protein [Candidatus Thermoplasmatota archaeon]
MAKETIQIRIDEETSRFVNRMLSSGLFRTKSEAIRYILSAGITAAAKFPEVSEKVEKLKSMEKTT